VVFQKAPETQNLSPFAGFQFYGDVQIDQRSEHMTVKLKDVDGKTVFSKTLQPVRGKHK